MERRHDQCLPSCSFQIEIFRRQPHCPKFQILGIRRSDNIRAATVPVCSPSARESHLSDSPESFRSRDFHSRQHSQQDCATDECPFCDPSVCSFSLLPLAASLSPPTP